MNKPKVRKRGDFIIAGTGDGALCALFVVVAGAFDGPDGFPPYKHPLKVETKDRGSPLHEWIVKWARTRTAWGLKVVGHVYNIKKHKGITRKPAIWTVWN